jgi:hypothetical protein
LATASALLVGFLIAGSTTALAVGPQATLASHGDPFAGCRVGGDGSGLNFQSAVGPDSTNALSVAGLRT